MKTKLQEWAIVHEPKDEMLWKKSYWDTIIFWRDRIIPNLFWDKKYSNDFDKFVQEINNNTEIVGEHWSKSIINPVLKISYKDCIIIFRYNFYDYEIAVINNKPINIIQKGLFTSKNESFYYQGIPEEYQLKDRYEDNKKQFMVNVRDHYDFYTFMFLLKNAIDNCV